MWTLSPCAPFEFSLWCVWHRELNEYLKIYLGMEVFLLICDLVCAIYEKKYYNFISNCCDTISIYGGNSQQRASNRQIIGNILLFNLEKRKLYVWKQSQFQMEIFNYGIVLWVVTADCWEMLCCKRVQINWCKILSWYRQASLLHRALHIFYSIA